MQLEWIELCHQLIFCDQFFIMFTSNRNAGDFSTVACMQFCNRENKVFT